MCYLGENSVNYLKLPRNNQEKSSKGYRWRRWSWMAQRALSIGVNVAPVVHGLITSSLFILAECWGVGGNSNRSAQHGKGRIWRGDRGLLRKLVQSWAGKVAAL